MTRIVWILFPAAMVAYACEMPLETERMAPPEEFLEARQDGPPAARGAAHVLGDLKTKGGGEFHVVFSALDRDEAGVQGHVNFWQVLRDKTGTRTIRRSGDVVCLEMDRRVKTSRAGAWVGAMLDEEGVTGRRAWEFYVRDGGNGPDAGDRISSPRRTKIAIDTDGNARCLFRTKVITRPLDRGNIQVSGGRGVITK